MPATNLHFPKADTTAHRASWSAGVRCVVMQGGQGDIKHWAFNDPLKREGPHRDAPPPADEYRRLATRVVDLHPVTLMQNARTSGGGNVTLVPRKAITVGPVETWMAEKVSIWHAGTHDNPLGQRLTALMISQRLEDSSIPMSLLASHPNVQFNYYVGGLGTCAIEMH
jgi:glucosamine-6-phosphate deaminase